MIEQQNFVGFRKKTLDAIQAVYEHAGVGFNRYGKRTGQIVAGNVPDDVAAEALAIAHAAREEEIEQWTEKCAREDGEI